MNIKETYTKRGFKSIEFEDSYDTKCHIQQSSITTEPCIWFGIIDAEPKIMASKVKEGAVGWISYPIPDDVLLKTEMHLTMEQVKELIPVLQKFADTGEL